MDITLIVGGCLNKIQSQQTKEKISKANKGKKRLNVKPISEEHKQRIRECNKGKIRTEENKKKISDSLKSKFTLMTPEEKSLRYGSSKGKSRTEKDKENISKNLKKFYAEHPEAKAKLANNNKGRIWSDETLNRRRNSMNKYYSNMSEEDKEKLSLRKRGKISKNNKSGYIGVCSKKGTDRFIAYIRVNKKSKHIGSFPTAVETARAYDAKAKELFGEFARLNFPLGTGLSTTTMYFSPDFK